jgi:hypothetical protein
MTFAVLWHKLAATVDDVNDASAEEAALEIVEVTSMTDVLVKVITVAAEQVCAAKVTYEVTVEIGGAALMMDVTVS